MTAEWPHFKRTGDGWYSQFLHLGKQRTVTIGKASDAEAKAKSARIDCLLLRLKPRLIELPPGVSIVDFVRLNGKASGSPSIAEPTQKVTLGSLRDPRNGSPKHHILRKINRHFKHLARILGEGFPIRDLSLTDLQGYVTNGPRRKAGGVS